MLRNLFKPFKRWAFNRAKIYTYYYIDFYTKKYIKKFLNKKYKIEKLRENKKILLLINKLNNNILINEIQNNINNNNDNDNDNTNNIIKVVNNYLIKNANIIEIYNYELILELSNYINNLNNIYKKDIGLDHSKVREYWLKRGPRILISSFIFIIYNYIGYIYIKEENKNLKINIYMLSINILGLILAVYMLYFRLPDSIESAIARSTHDYYVLYKRTIK